MIAWRAAAAVVVCLAAYFGLALAAGQVAEAAIGLAIALPASAGLFLLVKWVMDE